MAIKKKWRGQGSEALKSAATTLYLGGESLSEAHVLDRTEEMFGSSFHNWAALFRDYPAPLNPSWELWK